MTIINEFNYKECEKIDARKVNAYLELQKDPENLSNIVLDSSWGTSKLNISDMVHYTETVTTLKLSPANAPTYLEYDGETGIPQCIYGQDLARIIPMTKLKDVNQSTAISGGRVYMYNSSTSLFEPYNLQAFVDSTNASINTLNSQVTVLQNSVTALQAAVTQLQNALTALTNRVSALETILTRPNNIPSAAKVVWGTINAYSDSSNSSNRNDGFYTHSISTDKTNDEFFA